MNPETSGLLDLSLYQIMVAIVNDEKYDVVTPVSVLTRVPYQLVSSSPRNKSRKDR